jgi:hypothetical protein
MTARRALGRSLVGLIMLASAPVAQPGIASAQPSALPSYITNGPVYAIARSASTIYIGGRFSVVGPVTGPAADISPTTGAAIGPIPQVSGGRAEVDAVLPDGHGGWFVAGSFTQVGTMSRQNLAHILASGAVDPGFNPSPTKEVFALALSPDGTKLYVGGSFRSIAGQQISYLAALNPVGGTPVPGFAATPNGTVVALAPSADGNRLYVSGAFNVIGGRMLTHLAAVDARSGTPIPAFAPNPSGGVFALAPASDGSAVYAAGTFTTIGGQSVAYLAALDPATGSPLGGFAPSVSAPVFALALGVGVLYAGGDLALFNGSTDSHLAALDPSTGAALSGWSADTDSTVFSLALSHDGLTLYAGGDFQSADAVTEPHLAAFDATSGSLISGFSAAPNGGVATLAVSGDGAHLYAGGGFTSIGAQPAEDIAALSASSGMPVAGFAAAPGSEIHALALAPDGSRLYAGGGSTGLSSPPYLGALDPASGAPVPAFAPSITDAVRSLAVSADGSRLYAGFVPSLFTTGGTELQAFNTVDGSSLAGFAPAADSAVLALALSQDGTRLYAAGTFAQIGGQPVGRLAAVDPLTGAAIPGFAPNPDGEVDAIDLAGTTLYAGGSFATIGGAAVPKLAAVNASTGAVVRAFAPAPNGTVFSLTSDPAGKLLYAGGSFTSIGGVRVRRLAALDPTTGTADSAFAPNPDDTVLALGFSADGAHLYAGGAFRLIGSSVQQGIAILPAAGPAPPPTLVPSLLRTGKVRVSSRHGRLTVDLGAAVLCPAGGASCTAAVTLATAPTHRHRRSVRLFVGTFTIPAGGRSELMCRLSKTAAGRVRKAKRLKVSERFVLRDGGGPVVSRTGTAVLKGP